jgi:AcrR family transcriptional regulator
VTEPTELPGRREENKRATRAALQEAAQRLFAERGYQHTTVRDIAEAAGVTERTFFRYFGAKEELVLASAGDWLEPVSAAIRARPSSEDAVTAVQRVVLATEALMRASDGPTLLSLYADRVPAEFVRADSPRELRMRLLVLETALAPAIRERLLNDGVDDDLLTFRSEALARTCVALVRTALLHDLALRRSGVDERPTLAELLDAAFTDLRRGWRP